MTSLRLGIRGWEGKGWKGYPLFFGWGKPVERERNRGVSKTKEKPL